MTKRANRTEAILDAATRVLRRTGNARFSQPRVAKEAGLPQGHLTYYFPKRVDIIRALSERFGGSSLRALSEVLDRAREDDRLHELLAFSRRLILDVPRTRMMLALMLETDATDDLRPLLEQFASRASQTFGRGLGEDATEVDRDILHAFIWGLGVLHFVRGGVDPERVERALARFEGLMKG